MSSFTKSIAIASVSSFLCVAAAFAAYTEAPVTDGGTLSGKVSFKGAQPPPEKFDFAKFPQPKFCSQVDSDGTPGSGEGHRLRQDVKVNKGGLADAVVYITNIQTGKPLKMSMTELQTNNCRFLVQGGPSKSVGVIFNDKTAGGVSILNTDADPSDPKTAAGVLHNPHGYSMVGAMSTTIFNKPLPTKGQVISEKVKPIWFKKADVFMKIECDQHNYMNAWALPVENPYYAIVNDDGTFSIDQIPPGKYEVKAFHPKLGFKTAQIDVPAKGKATANFEF
ncbi:MAG: carboxypeptidase regulatory-like domain-containing protein [Nitrospirae bacterium]|nr:carboxypeptidase regulatory-like domain-containing protein [Candidatus Troglogloeales bacterium]MBI3597984.1 carboxypeptidase regulatory-like domain-containing protein [Candidatus Troglogloeales bacterium]